jgi:hypothetical protein
MARRHPRALKVVVSHEKVYEVPFCLHKERSKILVKWEKWLKETRLGVSLGGQLKLSQ